MSIRCAVYNKLVIVLIICVLSTEVNSGFEFTNIKCNVLDPKFADFESCYLKSINRTYKYASLKLVLHQLPVTNINIQFVMMKRLNGYKPFLYNINFNFCNFIKNPNPGNKVVGFFHGLIRPYSNLNHTCPYTHDLIVDKLPISFLNHKLTELLPVPDGDYRITVGMIVNGINRGNFMVYFKIY